MHLNISLYIHATLFTMHHTHHYPDKCAGHNGAKLIIIVTSASKHP